MFYTYNGFHIPDYMAAGIEAYIYEGVAPGGFLRAIICNDLTGAVSQADDTNIKNIPAFVGWFYNRAPSSAWGSPEKMREWMIARRKDPLPRPVVNNDPKVTVMDRWKAAHASS